MARIVAVSIPPITEVPIAMRLLAPAPDAMARGKTPAMNDIEVIRIGRRRMRAASSAASMMRAPRFSACSANSIIRIAFLEARPIVVSSPIWRKTSFCRPRKVTAKIAPTSPSGITSSTAIGIDQLS